MLGHMRHFLHCQVRLGDARQRGSNVQRSTACRCLGCRQAQLLWPMRKQCADAHGTVHT